MSVRLVLLAFSCAACGHPASTPDAGGVSLCDGSRSSLPRCSDTCGNGVLDSCLTPFYIAEDRVCFNPDAELCDGTFNTSSCDSFGYYGGTLGCTAECKFDDHGCDPCAPSVACTAFAVLGSATTLVSSDPSTLGPPTLALTTEIGGTWLVTRFEMGPDGLAEVGQLPNLRPVQIGVTGGWFAAFPSDYGFDVLDANGNLVGRNDLFTLTSNLAMGYGPGAHALVTSSNPNTDTKAIVLDASGATVASPFVIFAPAEAVPFSYVTTDGTSFFVAGKGVLARISADGSSVSVTPGFPIGDGSSAEVSWDGTTGWYVVPESVAAPGVHTAQAFDSAGAKVGAAVTVAPGILVSDHIEAYGTGLVAFSTEMVENQLRFGLVRFDATGAVVSTDAVGVGLTWGESDPTFARFGSQIAVTWFGAQQRQLALVTP